MDVYLVFSQMLRSLYEGTGIYSGQGLEDPSEVDWIGRKDRIANKGEVFAVS